MHLFFGKKETIKPVLIPYSLRKVIMILANNLVDEDWFVGQQFMNNGKIIYVSGFGKTREDAIIDFDNRLKEEECQ